MAMTLPLQQQAATISWTVPSNGIGLRRHGSQFTLRPSFLPSSLSLPRIARKTTARTAFRVTARVASKQAYICRDCGYIYNDNRKPFDKLPDNYFCPVCSAPKRRFKTYDPPASKNANDTDVRKARKAALQKDEAIGRALPIAIVVGIAILGGIYFYLNSVY